MAPSLTDVDGVFVAGVAAGPKDIVDTITEAGGAAMEAAKYLAAHAARNQAQGRTQGRTQGQEATNG
jgi:heterodisulfide reductase subunit A